jgi:ABC-type uncharacterized transport system permease subunit
MNRGVVGTEVQATMEGHRSRRWHAVGIRRLVVLVVGISGLLALFAGAAQAGIMPNHCEPLLRR